MYISDYLVALKCQQKLAPKVIKKWCNEINFLGKTRHDWKDGRVKGQRERQDALYVSKLHSEGPWIGPAPRRCQQRRVRVQAQSEIPGRLSVRSWLNEPGMLLVITWYFVRQPIGYFRARQIYRGSILHVSRSTSCGKARQPFPKSVHHQQ